MERPLPASARRDAPPLSSGAAQSVTKRRTSVSGKKSESISLQVPEQSNLPAGTAALPWPWGCVLPGDRASGWAWLWPQAARAAPLSSRSVDHTATQRGEAAPEATRQELAAEAPPRKEEPRAKGGCGQSHKEPEQSLAPASSGERSHLPRAVCLEGKWCASSDPLSQGL